MKKANNKEPIVDLIGQLVWQFSPEDGQLHCVDMVVGFNPAGQSVERCECHLKWPNAAYGESQSNISHAGKV